MALNPGDTAPYGPPAAVIEVITRYRERGLPTPITTEVLERAGVSESLSRRTLQSLKLLRLIDSEGKPTAEFEAASRASDDEYKQLLSDLICDVYADVITLADPATDSYDRVRDAFRGFNPRGQQERQITLFLGLLEFVGIDVSAATASRKRTESSQRSSNGSKPSPRPGAQSSTSRSSNKKKISDEGTGVPSAPPPGLLGLLQQIPGSGRGWTQAKRDGFIAAFTAVLDFTVPVRDEEPAPDSDEVEEAR